MATEEDRISAVIIGYGAIGKQREKALLALGITPMLIDPDLFKVYQFPESADWVFICTPHHITPGVTIEALRYAKNILVEKPLGRTYEEYADIVRDASNIHVGFNYRFYKGVNALLKDIFEVKFGTLISVNMILGLGDAPETVWTWRLDPHKMGRGAILDPGIHLIDLAILMARGTIEPLYYMPWNRFWRTGIEEESHVIAKDRYGTIYNIQASKVKWRNTFRIEVNGTEGYGILEGRGGHYGNQTYIRGKRWAWKSGVSQRESEEIVVDYDANDSFLEETRALLFGTDSVIKPATAYDNGWCLSFIDNLI